MIDFDDESDWGQHAPRGFEKLLISLCHALPTASPMFYSLNKGLRRPLKSGRCRLFDVQVLNLKLRLQNIGNYCETTALLAPQFYDTQELDWLQTHVTTGDVFLDVGGNIGLYSLCAAARIPGIKVYTVEPDPSLAQRMHYNARINGLSIKHLDLALSDFSGEAQLDTSAKQSGENTLRTSEAATQPLTSQIVETQVVETEVVETKDSPAQSSRTVRVTTLLELCQSQHIETIKMMKIDIEGHEHRVLTHFLTHADKALWPALIIIEHVHDKLGVMELLTLQNGYQIVAQTHRNSLLRLSTAPVADIYDR